MGERPKEGDRAPEFRLPSSDGGEVSLADFRGKEVVLYFYVKDNTTGCTKQACSLRDSLGELKRRSAVVLGVSLDDLQSHAKFKAKYSLPFPLLSDTDARVSKAYGVYGKKNLYGRESWGIRRTTFLLGPDGRILKVFPKVDVQRHGEEILRFLDART